jgi:hypothetical protein
MRPQLTLTNMRADELPLTPVTPTVSGYEVNLLRNDIKSVQATTVINGQEGKFEDPL